MEVLEKTRLRVRFACLKRRILILLEAQRFQLCHIMRIMWFSFCLDHQTQTLNFSAVFCACGHDIDACGVDTAVAQDVRQLCDILLNAIESPGKELAQIVGEYLAFLDACGLAQLLHLPPDAAAVQGFSAFAKKNRTGMDAPLLRVK